MKEFLSAALILEIELRKKLFRVYAENPRKIDTKLPKFRGNFIHYSLKPLEYFFDN
jgi:hypothetical protein